MIEQQVLMEIDEQRSWVRARLDLTEPLVAYETRMPNTTFGWFMDLTDLQRFQLAVGRTKRIIFNEGDPLYLFTFCEETNAFVATREDGGG